MEFYLYRDWKALQFIRCLTPIPESQDHAGGSSFLLKSAMAKCRSELAERTFIRAQNSELQRMIIGSGAHPMKARAVIQARLEAAETVLIERLKASGIFRGICIWNSHTLKICLRRTELGFACLIIGQLESLPFATLSMRSSLLKTFLKSWEEYRNVLFFKPTAEKLKTYTRVNNALSSSDIECMELSFDLGIEPSFNLEDLETKTAEHNGHQIAYILKGTEL